MSNQKNVFLKYANIKVPHTSPAKQVTQKKIQAHPNKRRNQILCKKKQKFNKYLYTIHLLASQKWGNMWYTILDSVLDATNHELEKKYSTLKKLVEPRAIVENFKNNSIPA